MNTPIASGGEGSAQPERPRRIRKARRNPDSAVMLVVTPEGKFVPANEASRQICRDRKLYAGIRVIAYLYQERDADQWAKAHGLGCALAEHVEDFHGLNGHSALKKLQEKGNIACEPRKFPVPQPVQELLGVTHINLPVPRSLAFDEMDESEFQEVYGRMVEYVRQTYWPTLDEAGMQGMQKLLGMGS